LSVQVTFHYAAGDRLKERLRDLKTRGLSVTVVAPEEDASFAEAMKTCEVLWHVLKPVTRAAIERAPRLRLIQKLGAGVDTIDLEAARARGIPVCNLPGTNANAVAEHAIALMLAVLRKVPHFNREMRAGQGWSWPIERQGSLGEIRGRSVGLVGYGATASRLAPILEAFGAKVFYTTRSEVPDARGTRVTLDELLERCDIISLHVPHNETTRGMFDRARIARMKPGAILINTARGGLVDQDALIEALQSGHLAGAGLDTFAIEPVDATNPLLALDTVVATPHVAWLTMQTFDRSLDLMAENCRRLAAGEELLHRVV
jgi:phosphoglycerate dehydrogenase-like enzyme